MRGGEDPGPVWGRFGAGTLFCYWRDFEATACRLLSLRVFGMIIFCKCFQLT